MSPGCHALGCCAHPRVALEGLFLYSAPQDCDKDITGHVHWKGSILLVSWGGALGGRGV